MKADYIIVGCGLSGICFAEIALNHGKNIMVFNDESQQASKVAAGVYNPVILKRLTKAWKAEEQLPDVRPFFSGIETKIKQQLDHKDEVHRVLTSAKEQNNWFEASDNPALASFLSSELVKNQNEKVNSDYDLGRVKGSGRIDTATLVEHYMAYLKSSDCLKGERFNYDSIEFSSEGLVYQDIEAKYIIFAEGFGLKHNPFFKDLPIVGNKGELLIIEAEDLQLNILLKGGVFVIPLGDNKYKIGATYNRQDKTNSPSEKGKKELIEKLEKIINCDYEIIAHQAGIRPTTADRRPIIGRHYQHENLFVINGMGSRGVMQAPQMAKYLFEFIEKGKPIDYEINSTRFY